MGLSVHATYPRDGQVRQIQENSEDSQVVHVAESSMPSQPSFCASLKNKAVVLISTVIGASAVVVCSILEAGLLVSALIVGLYILLVLLGALIHRETTS